MTISDFIKEQANERAEAAAKLAEELEINGIRFLEGCNGEGLQIYDIEKLAAILGYEIQIEPYGGTYATYFFYHNNVKFFERKFNVKYAEISAKKNNEASSNV